MLKNYLSISGKPGLYKLISQGKNMLIVESLTDKKRQPAYARDKVISLADIAIFTESGEVQLSKVFKKIFEEEKGEKIALTAKSDPILLREYLEKVLPEYDKDRVYLSDIRKLVSWYNQLIENGITVFSEEETSEKTTETTQK